ncbi:uncharacterized serine-rich protein C215.13-like [Lucilia sericata]|uniref:uncharacterized serine-rich protein C215.13-like n=1 Tax=Lucilia sericata TaxID=13632 RepID=UPI0018A8304A|nr:uncharacterized serine-rich protein C215.13-like [Lucilia sericata]
MDGKKKFDDTSKKFRKRMEEEKAKVRRTIFIDDEMPTTSKKRKTCNQPRKTATYFRMSSAKPQATVRTKEKLQEKTEDVCKENQTPLKNKYISPNKGKDPVRKDNKDEVICLSSDEGENEDHECLNPTVEENIPPTPGNDVVNSPMYAPPNYHIDNLGNEEQEPWFSPLYGEPEVPMTPGKSNNDAYSPPCDRCNSNDCSEEELLPRPEDDVEMPSPDEMEEIFRSSFGHFDDTLCLRQPSPTSTSSPKSSTSSPQRKRSGWFTIDVKDERCHNFCGHMGYQRSIIYRFWVDQDKQYPEIGADANANKENQYLDSPSSSQLSWLEVSPNPRLVTTTPAPMRRLSQSSAEKSPSLTPVISLFSTPILSPLNLSILSSVGSHTSIKSQTSLLYFAPSCAPSQSIRQHQSSSSTSSSSSSPSSSSTSSSPSSATSISSPVSSTPKPSSTEILEIEDENVQQPEETSDNIPNQRMSPTTTPIPGWDDISQMPSELRAKIEDICSTRKKGQRVKFLFAVDHHTYNVTIAKSGNAKAELHK